jgi:hypothetical protein
MTADDVGHATLALQPGVEPLAWTTLRDASSSVVVRGSVIVFGRQDAGEGGKRVSSGTLPE